MDHLYTPWRMAYIRGEKKRLVMIGQQVRVQTSHQEIVGLAQSVDRDGALNILKTDGSVERVIAGDIALGQAVAERVAAWFQTACDALTCGTPSYKAHHSQFLGRWPALVCGQPE